MAFVYAWRLFYLTAFTSPHHFSYVIHTSTYWLYSVLLVGERVSHLTAAMHIVCDAEHSHHRKCINLKNHLQV
jgi:hypothetical protein